jgi:hypothetical protein
VQLLVCGERTRAASWDAATLVAGQPTATVEPEPGRERKGASTQSQEEHLGGATRAVASVLAVLGLAVGLLVLPQPQPAHAAFKQATAMCWPGPSGNACARVFYDASTRTWRAHGAVDPAPGKWIDLLEVWLWECVDPDCHDTWNLYGVEVHSSIWGYQRGIIDRRGHPCYWRTTIFYVTPTGAYVNRHSPIAGPC